MTMQHVGRDIDTGTPIVITVADGRLASLDRSARTATTDEGTWTRLAGWTSR